LVSFLHGERAVAKFFGFRAGFLVRMDDWMTRTGVELAQRIGRRYRTAAVRLSLEGLELPFTRIAEPDRVLDDVVAAEDRRQKSGKTGEGEPPRVPYWAELWESALAVGQVIGREGCAGLAVLDLGCGMGLAGAAAAAMGGEVLLADLEADALLLARLNTLPWRERVRVRRVNWQTDDLSERFDLIVGADILYERSQWDYLHAFWRAHLADGGTILLGEPGRQTGDVFGAWAREHGWAAAETAERVASIGKSVRIFRLRVGK
jgi:predicted nicotinamide N-methyase